LSARSAGSTGRQSEAALASEASRVNERMGADRNRKNNLNFPRTDYITPENVDLQQCSALDLASTFANRVLTGEFSAQAFFSRCARFKNLERTGVLQRLCAISKISWRRADRA